MSKREDIIRKIKLLVAMEKGGSEAEMLSAAAMKAALLAKYNIELAEIEEPEGTFIDILKVPGKYNESWRKTCYASAAKMYFCNYFFQSYPGDKIAAVIHCLVGEPHNQAVAADMASYFEATINRLANDAAKQMKNHVSESHTTRHQFIRTFRLAASERLRARVNAYVDQGKQGLVQDTTTGSMLPALGNLYDRQDALYEAWKEAMGLTIRTVESRDQYTDRIGGLMGQQAGDKISLSTQISSSSAAAQHALT